MDELDQKNVFNDLTYIIHCVGIAKLGAQILYEWFYCFVFQQGTPKKAIFLI